MFVDELGHDGDGHGGWGGGQDVLDLGILKGGQSSVLRLVLEQTAWLGFHEVKSSHLEADHVLPVDLAEVVLGQQAVAGGGAVLHQRGDLPSLVDEAHVAAAVFVHGDGALEGPDNAHTAQTPLRRDIRRVSGWCCSPVPDHQLDAPLAGSLQRLVGLVCAPASTVLPVDLEDLVPETQASQGGRRVSLHQLDEDALRWGRGAREERTQRGEGGKPLSQEQDWKVPGSDRGPIRAAEDGGWVGVAYVVDGPQSEPHFSILVLAEDDLPQPWADLCSPDANICPRHRPHHPHHGRAGGRGYLLEGRRPKSNTE